MPTIAPPRRRVDTTTSMDGFEGAFDTPDPAHLFWRSGAWLSPLTACGVPRAEVSGHPFAWNGERRCPHCGVPICARCFEIARGWRP